MRLLALLSAGALAGCASTNSTTSARPETVRVVSGPGTSTTSLTINASANASVAKLSFPIDKVWRALPGVYDSLGIPLTMLDATKHVIGNEGMKIRQRLKDVALSKYIDCGQAQIGPSADSYDVFLTVTSLVRATSPTETEVATTVEAQAKPITFAQEYSRCSSKGTIETKVASILSARLAAGK